MGGVASSLRDYIDDKKYLADKRRAELEKQFKGLRISRKITQRCRGDIQRDKKSLRVVLIGTPGTGRRTLFKVGRLLFGSRKLDEKLFRTYTRVIQVTAIDCCIRLIRAAEKLGISIVEKHQPSVTMTSDVHTMLRYAREERETIEAVKLILSYENLVEIEYRNVEEDEQTQRMELVRERREQEEKEQMEQDEKDEAYRNWRKKRNLEGGRKLKLMRFIKPRKIKEEEAIEWKEFNKQRILDKLAKERAKRLREEREKKREEERKRLEAMAAEAAAEESDDSEAKSEGGESDEEEGEEEDAGEGDGEESEESDEEGKARPPVMNETLALALERVWKCSGIQEVWQRKEELGGTGILDSSADILNQVDDLWRENWEPMEKDVLMASLRYAGVVVDSQIVGQYRFELIDTTGTDTVTGFRGPSKWMHIFSIANVMVYVVSLGDAWTTSLDDPYKNRLEESMRFFEYICDLKGRFRKMKICVIMNKNDIFKRKIEEDGRDLRNREKLFFMDYNGGANYDIAIRYLKDRFNKIAGTRRKIFVRASNALDLSDMKICWGLIRSEGIAHAFGTFSKDKEEEEEGGEEDEDEEEEDERKSLLR
eukprot:g5036.t1